MTRGICFVFIVMSFSWQSMGQNCRYTPLTEADVTPEGLERKLTQWKQQNPQVTTDDLVCCLPPSWRSHFLVIPESESLHCSQPQFPRILLYNPELSQKNEALKFTFSFVGPRKGDNICAKKYSGVNNFDALEMLSYHPGQAPNEVFQMHQLSAHHQPLRGVNPVVCVDCHGSAAGGLRPFAHDLGSQFSNLGGFSTSVASCRTEAEKKKVQTWLKSFDQVVEKQRPYSCLIEPLRHQSSERRLDDFEKKNAEFVKRLAVSQNDVIVQKIKASKVYENLKFSLVAVALGCTENQSSFRDYLPEKYSPPSEASLAGFAQDRPVKICHRSDGDCREAIPPQCAELIQKSSALIQKTLDETQNPAHRFLAQAYYNQGRTALQDPLATQKMVEIQYLINTQNHSKIENLDRLMSEYPGPRALDYQDFVEKLIRQDSDFEFLQQSKAADKANCGKLKALSQKRFKTEPKSAAESLKAPGIR